MDYQQTLDFLFRQLPMFQRIGAAAYKANLDNTIALCEATGNPHLHLKTIHVAGTNGKGSVSHMLASVFQESGLKTALFTSPHLRDFRERMKINGQMIPEKAVVDFVAHFRSDIDCIKPSFFELTFCMAAWWFAAEQADVAVFETGMGGRLDSTNVITPLLSVITNIGLDHVQYLGPDIAAIAREKAGIIKPKVPVVVGETHTESASVFIQTAAAMDAPLRFADQTVTIEQVSNPETEYLLAKATSANAAYHLECPLTGNYQLHNLATVVAAIETLNHHTNGLSALKPGEGIRKTIVNTGLMGRWQSIGVHPRIICDIAHNAHGLEPVMHQLLQQSYHTLRIVVSVVNDKDLGSMLSLFPASAVYYFCKADIPRGLDAGVLQQKAAEFELRGNKYNSVAEAFKAARAEAATEDLIFVGGSAFTVAEVI